MKKVIVPLLLTTVILFSACARPTYGEELKSDKARLTPNTPSADIEKLVSSNTEFATALYQVLKENDGNFLFSPYSISIALAMTYGGARGQTEQQMADALHFTLDQASLHSAFNTLDAALNSRGQNAKGKDDQPFSLKVVNAIWGQKDFKFDSSYLDLLAQNYGAGLRVLDFMQSPEDARKTINDWVDKETEQRIKDLLPQGSIDELTRLVLTNAVYFSGGWLTPFSEEATSDGLFTVLNGGNVTVPMMHQTEVMGYGEGKGYQAVELKYDGSELSMIIVLPAKGAFNSFEAGLDSAAFDDILGNLKYTTVNLTMPKFEFNSEFGLKEALSALGMPVAFTDQADFSGMTGNKDLKITDVLHKAFISVDESGTEAAAASGVVVGTTSAPVDVETMTVDHPFTFFIRDIATGTTVFSGRVVDPSK